MFKHLAWAVVPFLLGSAFAQERSPLRTLIVDGHEVTFETRDGYAITEGDIILGTVAELEAVAAGSKDGAKVRSAVVSLAAGGLPPLWPEGVIYYEIDPLLPSPKRVTDAIAHWNARTPLKLFPRTAQVDYVRFTTTSGNCSSSLGLVGGAQRILLASGCDAPRVIHEIGHAFGLQHEQSRKDRDTWLTILSENIATVELSQYRQSSSSSDVGYYDYGSIMHYGPRDFSGNRKLTMASVPPGIPLGQFNGLSAGDIDGISRIYGIIPTKTTVTTIPEGLVFTADGEQYVSPHSFDWAEGSTHSLNIETSQTVSPDVRHNFVRWSDGGSPSHVFTASAAQTAVAAEFRQSFRLNAFVVQGLAATGTVTVEPASVDGYYVAGTSVRISAQPSLGNKFYSWSSSTLVNYNVGYGAPSFTVELTSNLTVGAIFSTAATPLTTIDTSPTGQLIGIDGGTYRTPVRFSWTQGSQHNLTAFTQTVNADTTRYQFRSWEDGSLEPSRAVMGGTVNAAFTAQIAASHYLDFTRVGSGSIDVTPFQPAKPFIDEGSNVELQAFPLAGQTVQYWAGDVSGTGTTKPLLIDRPRRAVVVLGTAIPFRITHAASYALNPTYGQVAPYVAPLEIVTLFGDNLGPAVLAGGQIDSQGRLSSNIANTRILFDGIPAPIVYASAGQTSVVVPGEIAGRTTTTVTLERNGQVVGTSTVLVAETLPGLFTFDASGSGLVAALNQDGSFHTRERGAERNSVMVLFAAGAGLMDRPLQNGEVMGSNLARPQAPVQVRIGPEPAEVLYAGSAPFFVNGALQINVRIPGNLPPGEWPVRVVMGSAVSPPGTTVIVK